MSLLRSWLVAFAMTLAIETPVVAAFYRRQEPKRGRLLGLIFFANLATHPAVWFIFPRLPVSYERAVFLSEVWAYGLEVLFYALAFAGGPRRAFLASITANTASFLFGLGWLKLFGHF